MDLNPVKKSFELGGKTVTIETGRIARQATGSVLVTVDDISVLGTVVAAKESQAGPAVFPADRQLLRENLRCGQNPGWFLQA